MHLAASGGSLEAVECLLELGAEVSPHDKWDNTPLDSAMRQSHSDVVHYLWVKGGVQGNANGSGFAARNASAFRAAAAAGDVATLQKLAPHTDVNASNYEQRTPMHLAASGGSLEAVECLLELGAEVSPRDRWARTPLDNTVEFGLRDVASFLQTKGAAHGSGFAARTASAFRAAAAVGDVVTLRRLAPYTDVNAINYEQSTPMHLAASSGSLEAVKCLFELGTHASPLDSSGHSPLDDAIRSLELSPPTLKLPPAMKLPHAAVIAYLRGKGALEGSPSAHDNVDSDAGSFVAGERSSICFDGVAGEAGGVDGVGGDGSSGDCRGVGGGYGVGSGDSTWPSAEELPKPQALYRKWAAIGLLAAGTVYICLRVRSPRQRRVATAAAVAAAAAAYLGLAHAASLYNWE